MEKNPLIWALATIIFGSIGIYFGNFDFMVIALFAVVIAKLIEIINKISKGN